MGTEKTRYPSRKHTKLYLLVVWGGVSIEKRGPFKSAETRLKLARRLHKADEESSYHPMDVSSAGQISVYDYCGADFE